MALTPPLDLRRWIDEHKHLLKPPVGNREVFPRAAPAPGSDALHPEFIVMVVGGPNSRTDFHVDPGEEIFYQLEGDMVLRVVEDGRVKDINIREGQMFLLPSFVPHSPQRQANTVGLVVERHRKPSEPDKFQWYCGSCSTLLYEETVAVTDIVAQLPPVFERYEARLEHRTCKACGWVMPTRAEAKAQAGA
jgi:3-hydroxyanthranilate 3,4-dioxygenase